MAPPQPHLVTLSVVVENKPGVLARVSGLIARRGWNIESLAVGPTEDSSFSRMTLVVDQTQIHIEQIVKQLYKLINVIKIIELSSTDSIARELLLVKVGVQPERRAQVIELAEIFDGRIVDVGAEAVSIELSGSSTRLNDFLALVSPYGIVELARTGVIGLERARKTTVF